jgi:hypothetical protein
MNKITVTNPSDELLHHALKDIKTEHENQLMRTAGRAWKFLSESGKGKKTFRSKPITVTVIK